MLGSSTVFTLKIFNIPDRPAPRLKSLIETKVVWMRSPSRTEGGRRGGESGEIATTSEPLPKPIRHEQIAIRAFGELRDKTFPLLSLSLADETPWPP
jgi:hypothetical protein